jgi:eukaryotic-like serine/threonine-protein kinase
MSTETMSQFLEGLHASRLLDNDRIDELLRRPEPPHGDIDGVARFLENNGWLTRFQINEIREGRGQSLLFSGYRLLERLTDQPSGPAFRAFHPALQQPVVVRWLNAEWFKPLDDVGAYLGRAQAASLLAHAHVVGTLDAGLAGEIPFLVQEYLDGAKLGQLVDEMGALPVPLACIYARQAALALQAAHERGLFHGDFGPDRMLLAPVNRKPGVNGSGQRVSIRPVPGASIKVAEIGLIPKRPAAGEVSFMQSHLLGAVNYLAPERLSSAGQDVKGDLYSLGATLYFLLAARPPLPAGSNVDALLQLQQAEPARIDSLRNDVPPPLADMVHRLLSKDPGSRPESAGEVASALSAFTGPLEAPATSESATPYALPLASETTSFPNALPAIMAETTQFDDAPRLVEALPDGSNHRPVVEALPEDTSDSQVYSPRQLDRDRHETEPGHHDLFGHQGDDLPPPRPRKEQVKGGWTWLIVGICLHVAAVTALVLWATGVFSSSESSSESEPTKKELKKDQKKKRK